jgi:hypothetical protein
LIFEKAKKLTMDLLGNIGTILLKEIMGCMQSYIFAIDVEHITGKEAIEYVRAKGK